MLNFKLEEIFPHIYHLHFDSAYDCAMSFVRFQEYYESPKYRKQIFTLVDYMEWYAKTKGEGAFTYPVDWSGFNVPDWAIRQVRKADIPDLNKYDQRMFAFIDWVEDKEFPHNYYFVGTSVEGYKKNGEEEGVLDHEIAHALYYTDSSYRGRVERLLYEWDGRDGRGGHKGEELDSAKDVLRAIMGYHKEVVKDEIQAYCATGLCEELEGVISEKEMEPFQELFQEFKNQHNRG